MPRPSHDRAARRGVQRRGTIAGGRRATLVHRRRGRLVGLAVGIALGLALRRAADREPIADARAKRERERQPQRRGDGPGEHRGPASVEAGSGFQVQWTGPNQPTDYVTIVAAGTWAWTDESYFYTSAGSPGTLVAPVDAGPHVLWYVSGNDGSILDRVAITVTPFVGAFAAPGSIVAGTPFQVGWKGPTARRTT